jgi:hypothetical protein
MGPKRIKPDYYRRKRILNEEDTAKCCGNGAVLHCDQRKEGSEAVSQTNSLEWYQVWEGISN